MDAYLGSWKLNRDKNEGLTKEYAASLGVSDASFSEFVKMQFTVTIAKIEDGSFTYTYAMEGLPQPFVQGPFKLGDKFEFVDSWEKRTEEICFNLDGNKLVEKTLIKEKPSINWVSVRSISGSTMLVETTSGGHTSKQFFDKV